MIGVSTLTPIAIDTDGDGAGTGTYPVDDRKRSHALYFAVVGLTYDASADAGTVTTLVWVLPSGAERQVAEVTGNSPTIVALELPGEAGYHPVPAVGHIRADVTSGAVSQAASVTMQVILRNH